jgi:hypothetical protein
VNTQEGIELAKWFGQLFMENTQAGWKMLSNVERGEDVLSQYAALEYGNRANLTGLLRYLEKVHWDLSCWYQTKLVHPLQTRWKWNTMHVVMPHFGWQVIAEFRDKSCSCICQMCGVEETTNLTLLYHHKFRVSKKTMESAETYQTLREQDEGFSIVTSFRELPHFFKKKRRHAIIVGPRCAQILTQQQGEIEVCEKL